MKRLLYLISFLIVFGLLSAQTNLPYVQEFNGGPSTGAGALTILGMTGNIPTGSTLMDGVFLIPFPTSWSLPIPPVWLITPLLVSDSNEPLIALELGLNNGTFAGNGTIQVQVSTTDTEDASFTTVTNGLIDDTSHPGAIANFITIDLIATQINENDEFYVRLVFTGLSMMGGTSVHLTTLSVTGAGGGTPDSPIFTIDPLTADFGTVLEGDTATPIEFTITNTGAGTLTITNYQITGADNAYFQIDPPFVSNINITDGDYTFEIDFIPVTFGNKQASLVINHNAAGSPTTIPLTGNHESTSMPVEPLPYHQEFNGGPATGNNVFNHLGGMTGRTVGMAILNDGALTLNFGGDNAYPQWIITPLIGPSTGETEISLDINLNTYAFTGEDRIEFSFSTTNTDDSSFTIIHTIDKDTHPNPISSMTTINVPKTELITENSNFYVRVDFYIYTQSHNYDANRMTIDNLIVKAAPDVNDPVFEPATNLTAVLQGTEIFLEWDLPVARALSYFKVFRNGAEIATDITQTFYTDDDIINNTDYSYHIIAVYESPDGVSNASNIAYIRPLFTPRNLTYTFDGRNVELNWLAPTGTGVTGYNVYRDGDLKTLSPITALSWIDTETENEETYIYEVAAVYTTGESARIDVIITVIKDLEFNPPRLLNVEIRDNFVHLTWHLPEINPAIEELSLKHFRVFRDDTLIETEVNQTQYQDTEASNLSVYTYHVSAVYTYLSNDVESEPSNSIEITVRYPVRSLTATSIRYDVRLDWTAPRDGADGYNVYRNAIKLNPTPLTELTFTDDDTAPASNYNYAVRAIYNGIESVSANISLIIPLISPARNLIATNDSGTVELSWSAPAAMLDFEVLLGYLVYKDESILTPEIITATSFTEYNVPNGTYLYRVIAVYELGESDPIEYLLDIDVSEYDPNTPFIQTELIGNYPNPFNPETNIRFNIAESANVIIEIYNIRGQRVVTLLDSYMSAGEHSVIWRGLDEKGREVGSGIFFYSMKTDDYMSIGRMLLLK